MTNYDDRDDRIAELLHEYEARVLRVTTELEAEVGALKAEVSALRAENELLRALPEKMAIGMMMELHGALKAENEHLKTVAAMETERVALAVEAEREACAAIVDPAASGFGAVPYRQERERLAALIRGRKP